MSAKSLLAALGFVLVIGMFAFSLWAEWGPYAWIAAAQIALLDSYFGKATFILTLVLFLVPAMLLLFMFISAGRGVKAIGFGVPALLVLAHFVAAVFFVCTTAKQAGTVTTFESITKGTCFLPQNIILERSKLPALDLDQASGVKSNQSSDELYVPFATSSWPSPDTPVVLKSTPENLKKLAGAENFKGIVRRAPLPYLVRHAWTQNHALFAVVLEDQATVFGFWFPAVVVYAVMLIWGAWSFFKSRRKASPQV